MGGKDNTRAVHQHQVRLRLEHTHARAQQCRAACDLTYIKAEVAVVATDAGDLEASRERLNR